MLHAAEAMIARSHGGVDIGYVKTILFPELYNADVPQPLSTQSYCRFTDKREITFASGGDGMIIFYPRTVMGPQLFIRRAKYWDGTTSQTAVLETPANPFTDDSYQKAGYTNYGEWFAQACLVSASISIQYIGQLQLEQGYMVGSQIYGVKASDIVPDDAENGQFRVLSKPGDGLRMIYMPKDTSDFNYYSSMKGTAVDTAGQRTRAMNQGSKASSQFDVYTYDAAEMLNQTAPNNLITIGGNTAKIEFATDADCLVIYYRGLYTPAGNADTFPSDLRIDVIRKFNGFPLSKHRDVLDLVKPKKLFEAKKSIDVICELQSAVPQLAGHSLKQMDRISDQIQEYLPNLGHLYNEGMLKEGTTLEGFGQQLQMLAGQGTQAGNFGRIYD